MNAAQESAFSARADEVSRALWPGRVRIGGVTYACSLVKTPVEISGDDVPGGVRLVKGIRLEISKEILTDAPAPETIVKDLADDALYRVKMIDGEMATDTSWFLTCARA